MAIIKTISDLLWGMPLIVLILLAGIIFTVGSKFFQIAHLKHFLYPSYQLCLYLDCCRFYFAVCLEKSQGKGKKHTEIIQICASTETSPYLSIAKFIQFEERRCLR